MFSCRLCIVQFADGYINVPLNKIAQLEFLPCAVFPRHIFFYLSLFSRLEKAKKYKKITTEI